MKFENTEVWGFRHALRGMRNPKDSWERSDSVFDEKGGLVSIGQNDLGLAARLVRSGSEHRKFLRQIFVSVDITAPLYWWKEFDTYKVGTVANSCSTMHTIHKRPIDITCFETGDMHGDLTCLDYMFEDYTVNDALGDLIMSLENLRQKYLETKDDRYWKELIRLLPESWLQKRTVTLNYENLLGMCSKSQRRFHKLTEWREQFISWARSLPYAQQFIFFDELESEEENAHE